MGLRLRGVLWASVLLSACFRPDGHGHEESDAGERSDQSGSGGSSGVGGIGGSSGVGGFGMSVGGSSGVGGFPSDGTCGGSPCESMQTASVPGVTVEGCCSPFGRCSLRTPGTECIDLGDPDPRCGAVLVGKSELPGCCVDGLCGVSLANLGLSCIGPDNLNLLGWQTEVRACAGSDAGLDAGPDDDAGR